MIYPLAYQCCGRLLLRAPITSDRIQLQILQVHEITNALKCTADHLQQLCEKMTQDGTLTLLKHTIQAGWSEKIQHVPAEIQAYSRSGMSSLLRIGLFSKILELSYPLQKGMVYWGKSTMETSAPSNVTYGPKKTIYWPGMTKDIEDMVHNCETCLKFSANNHKPKPADTLRHEVPVIAWTKLAMDIYLNLTV